MPGGGAATVRALRGSHRRPRWKVGVPCALLPSARHHTTPICLKSPPPRRVRSPKSGCPLVANLVQGQQEAGPAMAAESTAGNAWVDSYLDARERGSSAASSGLPVGPCARTCPGAALAVLVLPEPLQYGNFVQPRPAVLTYGLSSEYLKSTKEAQAKSKAPDADRSLYRWPAALLLSSLTPTCGGHFAQRDPSSDWLCPSVCAPCSRYYVQSLLNLDEQALHSAWSKVGTWYASRSLTGDYSHH